MSATGENDLPFDVAALSVFLREQDLLRGSPTLVPIGDGHSNLTYLISDGERNLVLRRPPRPPLPPGGHDVLREARIQRALSQTAVPVARILAVQDAGAVMDVPFYVMEYLQGNVPATHTPAHLDTPPGRRALAYAMCDTLAALHQLSHTALGLEDFGRPSADVAGHLQRFARIIDPEQQGLDGELGALLEWLLNDSPTPAASAIVHGDYRLGNLMLAPDAPARILAVLDWELASIGDPLRDVGYFLATYAIPTEPLHALTAMSAATLANGYPARSELAERYAAATGRELQSIDWYMAMALWKLAVLFTYQARRVAQGIGDAYYVQPGLVEGFLGAARPITTGVQS